jgi:hypothetical protein
LDDEVHAGFSLADGDFNTAILGLTVRTTVVGYRTGRTETLGGQLITAVSIRRTTEEQAMAELPGSRPIGGR